MRNSWVILKRDKDNIFYPDEQKGMTPAESEKPRLHAFFPQCVWIPVITYVS